MPADISNSDFDVNILEGAFTSPNIELALPLPMDKKSYVDIDGNHEDLRSNFSIITNFFRYFTSVDYDNIYKNNEYRYSINKFHPKFQQKMMDYMDDQLENSDPKLDELVYGLINQELSLKLITADQFYPRFNEVKAFIVNHYKKENNKNLPAFLSLDVIRIAYVTVMKVFTKMFPQGIWCSNREFSAMYQRYLKDPMSIIFLPNHQSHVDYIIIHLLAVRFQFPVPTVIAGENLNVAVFGKWLKSLGAIFIPRSMSDAYTERNLSNIIEFMLINKIHTEVFIEGTRSRDGKLLLPKYGILKTFVKIFLKQRLEELNPDFDLLFQPLSITYERIYETDGYLKELIGQDKKQESFLNIINNGLKNLYGPVEDRNAIKFKKNGFNDNSDKNLSGKIFIKLGEGFNISSFVNEDLPLDSDTLIESINLKKLGFQTLHLVNHVAFIPEAAIVGASLHMYYYYYNTKEIPIEKLIPVLRLVVDTLYDENEHHVTNKQLLQGFKDYTDDELTQVVKEQILYFFRLISVNIKTNVVRIGRSIELIYFKNLTIHSVIHMCKVAFILLLLDGGKIKPTFLVINKLNYILTGFMKNEFLFDYNYNKRDELSFILDNLERKGYIRFVAEGEGYYSVQDRKYLELFGNLVKPFLQSYVNLIRSTFAIIEVKKSKFLEESKKHKEDKNFDYDELRFPTTKTLLKYIISENRALKTPVSTESVNKQYLLSDLYYLNNLQVIQIFKNKAKTKAFVKVMNIRDLSIVLEFLQQLVDLNALGLISNVVNINYVIDIIDKNFDRETEVEPPSTVAIAKL
ncbi:uncharacterized protein CANTADRAFT_60556 [Suhomyces tanzawaensis NRRL Y-17324]|uniref:Phospholipid/glycerol acyltransferase domain-containing protein n=1 Tax=Suhomyces tanzawaensis NRRL Y-17324 TaxID=984487 RepID=A0A1E4SS18_9ASCO|nr:uncharacterized protein CANTADRAFT_60556 [Suhomyces tanzawaensis NRRL Y-17324]ODV82313.1 hypothetical protein CANTADRAFT_60556 [Suhomyces tanzawaensis NRRL Y-17324]